MISMGLDRPPGSGSWVLIREGALDDDGGVQAGSLMSSRASTHVGGLFSRRERVIHNDPGRGPPYWPSVTIEKDRRHIRPD